MSTSHINASTSKIREAISFISSVDRETWVRIGMAVKSELGEEGFDIWDSWSREADSYKELAARSVWKSIKGAGKIGIGTLFHEAIANGWSDNDKHAEPSAQEMEARRKARAEREAQAVREERKRLADNKKAADKAAGLIKSCKPQEHNYLRSKQLPHVMGLVTEDLQLVIPMRNVETNELQGAQVIKWLMNERQWEKKFLYGQKSKGAVFRLGSPLARESWLCEGYATGLSIEAALRQLSLQANVLVCFSAENMAHVASMIKGKKYTFADHDESGTGQAKAKQIGAPYCMSPVLGEDANDMHARAGLFALCQLMMETRKQ